MCVLDACRVEWQVLGAVKESQGGVHISPPYFGTCSAHPAAPSAADAVITASNFVDPDRMQVWHPIH